MLVEVRISHRAKVPAIGGGIADIRQLIESSRSSFCLTPSRVWIEGDRSEVESLLERCHSQAQSLSIRVLATSYAGRNQLGAGERRGAVAFVGSAA